MKKLLLLLLLPSIVLAQEDKKPRKLFLELKQGVGIPSIGIKYKNQKGNYWNVGVNTVSIIPRYFRIGKGKDYIYPVGGYANYEIKKKRMVYTIGGQTIITTKPQEFNPIEIFTFSPYLGVFYGNKFSFGLEVTGLIIDDSVTPYFTPLVRLKI